MKTFIHFQDVSKSFGMTKVVENLDLEVEKGEFLSLLGPSGSGKTTILMMLAGFENATSGTIRMDGERIEDLPPHKRGIGVVFQNYALFPHMTLAENIAFGMEALKPRRSKAAIAARVAELLGLVRLPGLGDRFPAQISGGQRQRVALARALAVEPRALLLDEPFGALDQFTREELWAIMQDLWLSKRLTVLLVTHDLKEAAYLANRICVMSARPGRILDDSPVAMPRPRTIEMTFEPDFVALNQRLRAMIVGARSGIAGGAGIVRPSA